MANERISTQFEAAFGVPPWTAARSAELRSGVLPIKASECG